jgi:hypothetical protein
MALFGGDAWCAVHRRRQTITVQQDIIVFKSSDTRITV